MRSSARSSGGSGRSSGAYSPIRSLATPLLLRLLGCCASARAGTLDLPPRHMWGWSPPGGRAPATASGYCGSMSLQTVGLYYGNWLSQDAVRGMSGGETVIG